MANNSLAGLLKANRLERGKLQRKFDDKRKKGFALVQYEKIVDAKEQAANVNVGRVRKMLNDGATRLANASREESEWKDCHNRLQDERKELDANIQRDLENEDQNCTVREEVTDEICGKVESYHEEYHDPERIVDVIEELENLQKELESKLTDKGKIMDETTSRYQQFNIQGETRRGTGLILNGQTKPGFVRSVNKENQALGIKAMQSKIDITHLVSRNAQVDPKFKKIARERAQLAQKKVASLASDISNLVIKEKNNGVLTVETIDIVTPMDTTEKPADEMELDGVIVAAERDLVAVVAEAIQKVVDVAPPVVDLVENQNKSA